MMICCFLSIILSSVIMILFFVISIEGATDKMMSSSFECGFSSYFFSRFSFSVHFYLIALIFLFLDLEICFVLPMFLSESPKWGAIICITFFLTTLLAGLMEEWAEGKLDWKL